MLKATVQTVTIDHTVAEQIRTHAQQQADRGGYEAVGFVACKYRKTVGVATVQLHNHAPDPKTHYFVEPWEQYRAEKKLTEQGYDILGVYHSHPKSEALPSDSDHVMARPGECMLIYSCLFDELKAYIEDEGILVPAELICE